jgi:hypothetical protein
VVILGVRALNQQFCTRMFAFSTLAKDETANFGTGALYIAVVSMLHLTTITYLKIMFVTVVLNQTLRTFRESLQLHLYLCKIQCSHVTLDIEFREIPTSVDRIRGATFNYTT